jgi:flap endonuclease-1
VQAGETEKAYSKATQSTKITNEIVESSRILLVHLGIPIVQAPGEGEAQAAYMAAKGDVWAASSQDFDSLLFGAPRLLKNLTLAGRRKMPGRNEYRDIKMEMVELTEVLGSLKITREQLIDICIMMGTDFNEGIRGIGPKKGLKLILQHGSFENAIASLGKEMPEYAQVRDIFLRCERTDEYSLQAFRTDRQKVMDMLVGEYDFSEQRVGNALDKMDRRTEKQEKGSQSRLDMFN